MGANIFIVEDDEQDLVKLIRYHLEKEGYKVISAYNGEDALFLSRKERPELILLDLMLPGIEVCKQIKKINKLKNIPVLMLTAKSEEEDKVRGFESGVDDYVTKPFSYKEILLRVKSLLKRTKPTLVEDISIFHDLKVDRITKRIFRGDKEIKVGPTEFRLLDFLIKSPKRVYSREQLLNNIWGNEINVEARTVDVHIRRLRKAINIEGLPELIRTVRSSGYSLDI